MEVTGRTQWIFPPIWISWDGYRWCQRLLAVNPRAFSDIPKVSGEPIKAPAARS